MPSGASETREEPTAPDRLGDALARPPRAVWLAVAGCLVGLAVEVWALVTGVEVDPSRPGKRRAIATLGLVGATLVGGGFLRLVREGELPLEAVLVLSGSGFAVGGFAVMEVARDPLLFLDSASLYVLVFYVWGSWVSVFLFVFAGVLWKVGKDLWKTALAAPVLLQAGAHLAVLLGCPT